MNEVSVIRSEILIFKVFHCGFTKAQLEDYFNLSIKNLFDELKLVLKDSHEQSNKVAAKILLNEFVNSKLRYVQYDENEK